MIEKIIYIGGVARSGTSWIGQIFNSCPIIKFRFQPFFSFEFRGQVNEDSTSEDYQNFLNNLFHSETDFLTQTDKVERGLYPKFKKNKESVLVFKENRFQSYIEPMLRKCKNLYFIGVIRNPNAVLYSWSQNEKEFPPGSDILEEWRFAKCKNSGSEDYFGYYKWKEVANQYLDLKEKYPNRVFIIHYDKFVENPKNEMKAIFQKMDLPYLSQTDQFIEQSIVGQSDDYYSVYKGKVAKDIWQMKFPEHIIEQIKADLKDTRLEQFLY